MKIDNLSVTNFDRFCQYHRNGDAGVEPRTLKNICLQLNLSSYERFKLCYYYQATYQIDSAIRLFNNPLLTKREVLFRTDRRYVRCLNNFERLKEELGNSLNCEEVNCKVPVLCSVGSIYRTVRVKPNT